MKRGERMRLIAFRAASEAGREASKGMWAGCRAGPRSASAGLQSAATAHGLAHGAHWCAASTAKRAVQHALVLVCIDLVCTCYQAGYRQEHVCVDMVSKGRT